jgi:CheY-like chemotaxis protein
MPDISGLELARRLRQRFPASELTLVAVTGNGRAYTQTHGGNLAQPLLRPVTTDTLAALLDSATLVHHWTGAASWP